MTLPPLKLFVVTEQQSLSNFLTGPDRLAAGSVLTADVRSSPDVSINLGERSYLITIGAGLLATHSSYSALPKAAVALIVTNTTVAPLYADALRAALALNYAQVHLVALPDGEEHKNWQTLNLIFDALLRTVATAKPCCSRWVVESLAT